MSPVSEVYSVIALAIVLIFIGTILILLDTLRGYTTGVPGTEKRRAEAGGVVIVGPIPIVFGSSRGMAKAMLVLAIVLTALAITLTVINYMVVR